MTSDAHCLLDQEAYIIQAFNTIFPGAYMEVYEYRSFVKKISYSQLICENRAMFLC